MDINKVNDTIAEEQELDIQEEVQDNLKDMSPEDKIALWKSLYDKIYLSVYDEQEFIWRKLRRREYTEIMENTPDEGIDDVVEYRQYLTILTCLLEPTGSNTEAIDALLEEYPGMLTSLSAEILKKSGFSKPLTIEI